MIEPFDKKIERNCYILAVSLIVCVTAVYILLTYVLHISLLDLPDTCIAYRKLHLYCPGCGGTRAVYALFQGKFIESFCFHPLVIYAAVVNVLYVLTYTLHLFTRGKFRYMRLRAVYFYLAVIIIFLQWFVKLGLLFFFDIHLV